MYAFVLGFLVFRSNQAYSLFWESVFCHTVLTRVQSGIEVSSHGHGTVFGYQFDLLLQRGERHAGLGDTGSGNCLSWVRFGVASYEFRCYLVRRESIATAPSRKKAWPGLARVPG
ncbi:unnamed protein product [Effrenium voratum]|uniref:Uncharacterized protein n=1 Tax=Effrenium voratum TaxID=2562239 RepID=A0AA36NFU9_9DINO|nr:unnamed protein product [Effrenium voratum]CAJ1405502.1 unnamed protein product [Effrenium voratum]